MQEANKVESAKGAGEGHRASLNEVLLEELKLLRPGAVVGFAAEKFAGPNVSDEEWDRNSKSRANNLAELYERVSKLGANPDQPASRRGGPLAALCLSGGGIRSAVFNLGVLQALAKARVLDKFDYLSSVSGGGYIAGWLQAWMHRESCAEVTGKLAPDVRVENPLAPAPKPIDNLRAYSNYLTPKLGLFSGDTWTAAAIILRNILLNWLVIVPLLAIPIAIPQFLLLMVRVPQTSYQNIAPGLLKFAVLAALVASVTTHWFRRFVKKPGTSQAKFVLWCLAPIVFAASLLSTATLGLDLPWSISPPRPSSEQTEALVRFAVLWCVCVPIAGWAVSTLVHFFVKTNQELAAKVWSALFELLGLLVSGAVSAWLLVLMTRHWLADLLARPPLYVVLVLPILLGLYLLAKTLFIAFASLVEMMPRTASTNVAYDLAREWWARLSGLVLLVAVSWCAVTVICILGTEFPRVLGAYAPHLVTAVGGVSGIATALLGKSAKTSNKAGTSSENSTLQKFFLALAAPVFVIAVIILIALGTAALGAAALGIGDLFHHDRTWDRSATLDLTKAVSFAAWIIGSAALLSTLMAWVVDINRFSLHGFYRNRLIRAFLGASSRDRKPDPFTGLAETDNISLSELGRGRPCLLPVINVALNLVKGDKLAWQERKAESFSMTPLFCGNFYEGYRRTEKYGGQKGISLGTAITISGAAASPNMGYHSSPAIGFLLTLLNARLGAWLGNTNEYGNRSHRRAGPLFGFGPLLGDLFGLSGAKSKYVNLSDGGHFDNLGLYEMVLRRCRYVFISDAGCDPDSGFEDLGNAIRKIRTDFGVPIEFKQKIAILARNHAETGLYCATAAIRYSQADGPDAPDGVLVYLKPTLRGRGSIPLPYDVYSYAEAASDFPHESTGDQWFSESQFESYRELGNHAINQIANNETFIGLEEFLAAVDAYMAQTWNG